MPLERKSERSGGIFITWKEGAINMKNKDRFITPTLSFTTSDPTVSEGLWVTISYDHYGW